MLDAARLVRDDDAVEAVVEHGAHGGAPMQERHPAEDAAARRPFPA
jgi:hypothetical protein